MKIVPYLAFNGECEQAFKFYEQSLGGKIEMMMKNGESPMANQTPPNRRDHIMHATMSVGGQLIQGADTPEQHFNKPQGFCVSLQIDDPAEADRIFHALSEGAKIQMPLQATFWAQRFGMLTDRFGIPWMINCGNFA